MCEILFYKKNSEGLKFAEGAFEGALLRNDDGAGYLILEKSGRNQWEVIDQKNYPLNETSELLKEKHLGDIKLLAELEAKEEPKKLAPVWDKWKKGKKKKKQNPLGFINVDFLDTKSDKDKEADYYEDIQDYYSGYHYSKERGSYEKAPLTSGSVWYKNQGNEREAQKMADVDMEAIKTALIDELMTKQENLKENQAMITHFRFATSGKNGKSTQPIIYGDYAVIHNGVFGQLGDVDYSDTYQFTKMIHDKTRKMREVTEKKEKAAIKKVLAAINGSYSIFIYSWHTKRLYYFISPYASFNWYSNKMELGATSTLRFPNKYLPASDVIIN